MDRRVGDTGVTTTSAAPDDSLGALLVVAAVVGLLRALAGHASNEGARNEPALKPPPDTPKASR